MTIDLSTMVADRFSIPTGIAAVIVADIDHAITDRDRSPTEVWGDLAADYAHQLPEHVELDLVIEAVSNHYGLTAGFR